MQDKIRITFFGVRGSYPVLSPQVLGYGGHTACVQIEAGGHLLIFDAGSGLQVLDKKLVNHANIQAIHIFLSHYHWDHLRGLQFFTPLFKPDFPIMVYGEAKNGFSAYDLVKTIFMPPYSPFNLGQIAANFKVNTISAGQTIYFTHGVNVSSISVPHPDGALAFKIVCGDKSCVYMTDIELRKQHWPQTLINFAYKADVLIMDAQYKEAEYATRQGWGHSTWQEVTAFARQCQAQKLYLFHHDVQRTDQEINHILEQARLHFSETYAAREKEIVLI